MIWIIIIAVIVIFIVAVSIFIKTDPQFGQAPKGEDLERIRKSPNYRGGQFLNPIETKLGSFRDMMKTIPKFINTKNGRPTSPLPVKFGENTEVAGENDCFITWFGHSSFMIEMEGKKLLIDPMFGNSSAPVSFGSKRFVYERPIPVNEMKAIDAIILTHDHYDHLDYRSILMLKEETGHFFTPLGVGSHLKRWGIAEESITEMDIWKEHDFKGIKLISCPSRHFSGRGPTDRYSTQWCGWIMKGKTQKIFTSGDGGYGPFFREIGKRYGPFDFAMLECGQYNKAWEAIHMMPEQSVQAGRDVNTKIMMPVHWGAFKLSVHPWTEPVERFRAEADKTGETIVHPYIGERFRPGRDFPREKWWQYTMKQLNHLPASR